MDMMKSKITPEIAELCGIIVGDGHLSRYITKRRSNYRIQIFGHKEDDREYLLKVQDLFLKAINVKPKFLLQKNCCELRIGSKKFLEFFENLGIPVGKKSGIVCIPSEIKNNVSLSCAFLRGLADTDFGIVLKPRKTKKPYPRISTSLKSLSLINDLCLIFKQIGINSIGPYKREQVRKGTFCITYQIDILGHQNLKIWMKNIGFRNPKHLNKLKLID